MSNLMIWVLLVTCAYVGGEEVPLYKYRYETEDVMKSAASNIPLHGYHVIEGGYYPEERIGRSIDGLGIGGRYTGGFNQGGLSLGRGYSGGIGVGGGYSSGGYSSGINQGDFGRGLGGGYEGRNIGYGGSSIRNFGVHGGGSQIGLDNGYINPKFIGAGIGHGIGVGGSGYGIEGGSSGYGIGGGNSGYGIGGGSSGYGIGGGSSGYGIGGGSSGYGIGGGSSGYGIGGGGSNYGIRGGNNGYGIRGGSNYGSGGGGGFIGNQGHGGEIVDKTVYNGEKKNLNDESYEKVNGKKGEEVNQGENSFSLGKVGVQNNKGDSEFYNDEQGGKKIVEDGKSYRGGEYYNQEGKNADEKKQKAGHRKGHVVKGFKSSHHKDETGRTEEYYDEAHDEGDNFNFQGKAGKFGEDNQSSFKGGHDNSEFNSDLSKKQGHYNSQEFLDKNNAGQGQYDQKKYVGNGQLYGVNNGIDQQSLLGHQESSRLFKHHPYYVPFYH